MTKKKAPPAVAQELAATERPPAIRMPRHLSHVPDTLYDRLFVWVESCEPCPDALRRELSRAFDAFFRGEAEHLEDVFGLTLRMGDTRKKVHRGLVTAARAYQLVQVLRDLGRPLTKQADHGAYALAAIAFGVSASTVEGWCREQRAHRPKST